MNTHKARGHERRTSMVVTADGSIEVETVTGVDRAKKLARIKAAEKSRSRREAKLERRTEPSNQHPPRGWSWAA